MLAFIFYSYMTKRLDFTLLFISFILLMIGLMPSFLEYCGLFFLITLLIVGIPHGSLDHLIYLKHRAPIADKRRFYSKYIALIILVGVCWLIFPSLSFILFLFISGYHFGQSQLYQIDVPSHFRFAYHLSWGMLLLTTIILSNFTECLLIFKSLEWLQTQWITETTLILTVAVSAVIFISIHTYLIVKGKMTTNQFFFEIIVFTLLAVMSIMTNAVYTFTVYFGLWHSFRSLILEYETLKRNKNYNWFYFLKDVSPLSLMGIAFLFSAYALSTQFDLGISFYMIFIIIISTLTVPHLIVMNKLYSQ